MKKIPLRKCIVTGEILPKKDLIRVVKDISGNIFVDPTSKANGHGAYLKKNLEAIERARKNKTLNRVFAQEVKEEVYQELIDFVAKN